jgi:hypothetical protein
MDPDHQTSKHLRALSKEIRTVIRAHAPHWTDTNESDPGVTVLQLLTWLADALSAFLGQGTGGSALDARRKLGQIVHHLLSSDSTVVTVDGTACLPASPESSEQANEPTYVLQMDDHGTATIRFGDGETGARPPAGCEVTVTYRPSGRAGLTVTVPWPPPSSSVVLTVGETGITFGPAGNPTRPIAGVPTSIAAFVGRAAARRLNDPVPIRSFAE